MCGRILRIGGVNVRKIALLLVCTMFVTCLVGCGQQNQTTTNQPSEYNQLHQIRSDELNQNTVIHEGLTELLPDLKNLIKDSLSDKDYLDWTQFESVSEIREFKSPELVGDFVETTAFYAAGSHAIVVCPKFFDIGDGDQQTYVLAHEAIHSLVGVSKTGEERSVNLFVEGITDYLAGSILADTNLNYSLTYQNELYCIHWLVALYGSDQITEIICNGEIIDFINERTGRDNAGIELHNALATLDHGKDGEEIKKAILTEIDILRAMSGTNVEIREKYTEIFQTAYAPYLN